MPYAGDIWYSISLDAQRFTDGTEDAIQASDKLDRSIKRTTESTRGMLSPITELGVGITSLGGATYALGSTMGDSGKDIQYAGTAVMAMGGAITVTAPLAKGLASILSGEVNSSVDNFAKLLGISSNQLLGIGAIVGITVTGALLAYKYAQDQAAEATKTHKSALEDAKTAADNYASSLRTVQSLKDELAGIPAKESELTDAIKRDQIRREQLIPKTKTGSLTDRSLAQLDLNDLDRRIGRNQAALAALRGRGGAIPGEISQATIAENQAWNAAQTADYNAAMGGQPIRATYTSNLVRSGTPIQSPGAGPVDVLRTGQYTDKYTSAMLSAKAGLGKGSTALENAQRQVSYESAINEYNKTWNALQSGDTDTAKLEAQRSNLAGKAGPLALSVAGNPNFYSDKKGGALTVGGIVSGVANAPIMPGSNAGGVPSGTVVNVLVNPGQWVDVPGTDVRVMRITNGG